MKKPRSILWTVLVFLLLLLVTIPVAAGPGGRTSLVVGTMTDSNTVPFNGMRVSLFAWENADGSFGGQGQIYFPPTGNSYYIDVTKICTGPVPHLEDVYPDHEYAVVIGRLTGLQGTVVDNGGFGAFSIADGIGNEPDLMVVFPDIPQGQADAYCDLLNTSRYSFHIEVSKGNFSIQTR